MFRARGPVRRASARHVVLLAVVIAGCGGGGASKSGAPVTKAAQDARNSGGGSVTMLLTTDWVDPFFPAKMTGGYARDPLFNAMYDRLVAISPKGEPVPYLAESWDATPSDITFTIKDGVTCSDGTPMTPTVIKAALDLILSKENASRVLAYTGPGPFTVTADDQAHTVKVTTESPNNELITAFAEGPSGIHCPAMLAVDADPTKHSYGSGAFVVDKLQPGQSVTLKRRDDWTWGPAGLTSKQLPEQLVVRVVENQATAANLFLSGGLDIGKLGGPDLARVKADDSLSHVSTPTSSVHHLMLNLSQEPFRSNQTLREAIFTAVNREEALAAELPEGSRATTNSIFGETMACYVDLPDLIPKYDPARAKQLFQQAGYSYEAGRLVKVGKPLTIALLGGENQGNVAEYLARALQDAGVTVKLRNLPVTQFTADFLSSNWQMTVHSAGAESPATANMVRVFTGNLPEEGGVKFTHVTDPELDAMTAAARTKPVDERCPALEEVQRYYLSHFYSLPLGSEVNNYFLRKFDRMWTDLLNA